MEHIACRYCIMENGLKGSEIDSLPTTDEELAVHIETEHHIPVQRDGETEDECMARFAKENPDAGGPNCKCPSCKSKKKEDQLRMIAGDFGLFSSYIK